VADPRREMDLYGAARVLNLAMGRGPHRLECNARKWSVDHHRVTTDNEQVTSNRG
jgi:hypothetical protein